MLEMRKLMAVNTKLFLEANDAVTMGFCDDSTGKKEQLVGKIFVWVAFRAHNSLVQQSPVKINRRTWGCGWA
jgi:hypothetical protein